MMILLCVENIDPMVGLAGRFPAHDARSVPANLHGRTR
jgi:hypothetical protein